MRFVTYNIQFGRGRDGRFDLDRIAAEVAGADVVALQEVERHWSRSGDVDQPAELARRLEPLHWVYGPGVDLDATTRGARGRRRQFGNMLLARAPVLSARNHLLPKYGSLGPMSLQRSALEAVIETAAGAVRIYSIHLDHLAAATRLPQVEAVLDVHRRAAAEGAALSGSGLGEEWTADGMPPTPPRLAILMGDFNAEPDSEEYARLVGPPSPYGGRVVNPEGFVDAWVEAGNAPEAGVTSDVRGRPARLDYAFVSAGLRERIRGAWIDERARGSDHQPVWVDVDL